MKKILFIATVVKTHINTFHLPYIKMFKECGYKTVVAAKNDYEDGKVNIPDCDLYIDIPFATLLISTDTATTLWQRITICAAVRYRQWYIAL